MSVLAEVDPAVAYPATETVPESPRHSRARFLAYGALSAHFAGHRDCFVGTPMRTVVRTGVADVLRATARTYSDDTECQRREEVGDDDSR